MSNFGLQLGTLQRLRSINHRLGILKNHSTAPLLPFSALLRANLAFVIAFRSSVITNLHLLESNEVVLPTAALDDIEADLPKVAPE